MRLLANEICESEHYNPSDSESGMWPRYREPCASVSILCSPQNHCMQMPLAGLIYMCNTKTRRFTLRRKFIHMPARKRWVNTARVRPGAKLFIFDYQDKLLWGTYEITTFPHFLRRGGAYKEDDLPYQIYFRLCQKCEPLEEEIFRHAIKENYYTPWKFHFGLSGDQVTNLLALFHLHTSYSRRTHQIIQPRIPEKRRFQAVHKFPALGGNQRGACKQHFREYKHHPQTEAKVKFIADSERTSSTSPILQKKSNSLKAELLQCDLTLGRADSFLMDDSPSCFQESLEQGDSDSSTYTSISLEDGEFILRTDKANSSKNRKYQKLQRNDTASVEEVDGDCHHAEYQTRNFIENLEHSLTSNSNTNNIHSSFSTAPDGEIIVAKDFDEANNLAQHVGAKDNEACEMAVWIEKNVEGLLARTLGKRTRIPSAQELSTDGGNKSKRSVWLRLSDPRPMKADHFLADEDAFEWRTSQQ